MKVKDIITRLQETYTPDTELVIAWWDRDLFLVPDETPDPMGQRNPTHNEWADTVAVIDDNGFGDHPDAIMFDVIYEQVLETIHNTPEGDAA